MSGRRDPERYKAAHFGHLQRLECAERSGGRCEFERAVRGLPKGSTHYGPDRVAAWEGEVAWVRCDRPMAHAAHIIRRWQCGVLPTDDGMPLKFHPFVVIGACLACHQMYDDIRTSHNVEVRLPAVPAELCARVVRHTIAAARARGEAAVDPDLSEIDDLLAALH